MPRGLWLKAHGSWPRTIWRWVPQARALAPNFSWPWAMSLEPRGMSHEPWAMSHEPLTTNNRLINDFVNSNFQSFQIPKFESFKVSKFRSSKISRFRSFNKASFHNFIFRKLFFPKNDYWCVLGSLWSLWSNLACSNPQIIVPTAPQIQKSWKPRRSVSPISKLKSYKSKMKQNKSIELWTNSSP